MLQLHFQNFEEEGLITQGGVLRKFNWVDFPQKLDEN